MAVTSLKKLEEFVYASLVKNSRDIPTTKNGDVGNINNAMAQAEH